MTTTATYNKTAWLGNYPAHWQVLRIKNIFSEIESRSTSGNEELLSVSHYTGITLKRESLENEEDFISNAETLKGYKKVTIGDLVINIMLAWNGSLGISKFDGITSPAYCVYRVKENNNPDYFGYLFSTALLKTEFRKKSTGIIDSRLRLYSDKFFSISAPIPPIAEQNKIVDYINTQTQKITHFIAKKQKFIALLKEQRQSIINAVVSGQLLVNNGSTIKNNGSIKVNNLRLKYIVQSQKGKVPTSFSDDATLHPYLSMEYLREKNDNTIYVEEGGTNILVDENEVLVLWDGANAGEIMLSKRGYLSSTMAILKPNEKYFHKGFFYFFLKSKENYFKEKANGTTIPHLDQEAFFCERIDILPYHLQLTTYNYLLSETTTIDRAIAKTLKEIELIKEYKEAMISEAVMGKINFNKKENE